MLESRIARGLMFLGAGVGVLGVTVVALEMQLNLPDWMVRVAMIKLAFVAAGGLLAAGALVGRHARTRALTPSAPDTLPHEQPEFQGLERRVPDEAERVVMRVQDAVGRRTTDERESG